MSDFPRLIEHAFPLKQTSLDSVHEKNVRHGHISTLHIWPARRPLAACRAALIATLLPDPGDAKKRKELCEKIGGKIVRKVQRKKMPNGQIVERIKEETEGGILHWGREIENSETLEWFRKEIKKAYGGRAPKVLDPFAGGGAIPLEAMRLGCESTSLDINPVAWFIQKCTLEYPQKLAGQLLPLPNFVLENDLFMEDFFKKSKGYSKAETRKALNRLHDLLEKKVKWNQKADQQHLPFETAAENDGSEYHADLSWHVRAWGQWVLSGARRELCQRYPVYADFEPLVEDQVAYEHQPMKRLEFNKDGISDVESLNNEFTTSYLEDKRNPRWVPKPAIAYIWARTVTCKNCRAVIPLLKTRWLCKKSNKRILLTFEANRDRTGVNFGIETNVPVKGGNAAQRREHDKRISSGTMSRAGAWCPCCQKSGQVIMTMEDIRIEGQRGDLGAVNVAVVIETPKGKQYRLPTEFELEVQTPSLESVNDVMSQLPFGPIDEPTATKDALGFRAPLYGFDNWSKYYTPRQMLALGTFVSWVRDSKTEMESYGYSEIWSEALRSYMACVVSRTADYLAQLCVWENGAEEVKHVFMRWALPMTWDFAEANPIAPIERFFVGGVNSAWRVLSNLLRCSWENTSPPIVENRSAIQSGSDKYDLVFTDPPYYDAIPYSDLMDFFYVWLRRGVADISPQHEAAFSSKLSPKWDMEKQDGELIDDNSRHSGDSQASKKTYEDGMFRSFSAAADRLKPDGHMVVVFANKKADAWETLAAAVIRAGFCVNGSWPIVTEMPGGLRNLGRASLASSVWLVCKKRPASAKPGWDNQVLDEMRSNISVKLREFWDAGIRGPDFVWAATGPAMEAYSRHPVVRKANEQNAIMSVGEFLNHVRRMVVDYIVGQVLTGEVGADLSAADKLDEVSAYYLLHRHDFGLDEAPVGACILYATACGLTDAELDRTWDVLSRGGKSTSTATDESDVGQDTSESSDSGSGSRVKLKLWSQRRGKNMGHEAPEGKAVPLIDRIHRLMHLWKDGDVQKVDEFVDKHGLRRNELFKRVVQSLIELSSNSERTLLESISNHIGAKGAIPDRGQLLPFGDED